MRCAIIEAETREEVIQEMEGRMQQMEKMYNRRLMKQMEQSEMKMDAKIDMLQRTGMLGRTAPPAREPRAQPQKVQREEEEVIEITDEEDEIERSLVGLTRPGVK